MIPLLNTNSIVDTVHFYTENLGFALDHPLQPVTQIMNCTLSKDDQRIRFHQVKSDLPFRVRLHFITNDPEQIWNQLRDHCEVVDVLRTLEDGTTEFAIKDNNGHILSFGNEVRTHDLYTRFFPPTFQLETPRVILRMMNESDGDAFSSMAVSHETWAYFTRQLSHELSMKEWVKEAIAERRDQKRVPFAVIDKHENELCGSTSFGNISFADKRIEIGWTWLKDSARGTGVNKAAKFALLSYAFEVMQMERVEIKTDNLNERSKAALLKVGMIPEGVLRSHMQMHSDRRRDTIYFSILKSEWRERKQQFFGEFL